MSDRQSFIEKLQEVHAFPCVYTFKIIGEIQTLAEERIHGAVRSVLPDAAITLTQRTSVGGRFIAWSMNIHVKNAETVADLYDRLQGLPGIRSLF